MPTVTAGMCSPMLAARAVKDFPGCSVGQTWRESPNYQLVSAPLTIALDARVAAEVPAGRGRYVRELIRGLVPLLGEHRLDLYARARWEQAPDSAQVRWRTLAGGDLGWAWAAGRAMRGNCDVALATSSYLLCAAAQAPVHSMVWDLAPFHRELHSPRGSLFERVTLPLAVRRCASLVAISAATRDELVARYPSAAARTAVAHPAAGPRFTATPSAADEQALARQGVRRPYVLATGTLEPRKNLPRLIEAFVSLPEHVRATRQLVLAGAPGWETAQTFAHVARHAGMVKALGYVPDEDLPALYRGADAFCYPSLYEGFGIPVLEAMSCGTAVLTSGRSSMPEVAGDAARYVDPYDSGDIARGLHELLSDSVLRETLAARGLSRARQFTWEGAARIVLAVLEGES
jgi:glycosyltransferase involved in cell wall biosynthesis